MDIIYAFGWDTRDPDDHEKIREYLKSLGDKARATFKALRFDGPRY